MTKGYALEVLTVSLGRNSIANLEKKIFNNNKKKPSSTYDM